MSLQPASLRRSLIRPTTLAVFCLLGAAVALAEWRVLPDATRILGAPALAAALLLDTFLYNEFLIRTGPWVWAEIYAFLYVEAAVIAAIVHRIRRYWHEPVAA